MFAEKEGLSYFFELASNGEKLFSCIAMCAAHARQRAAQDDAAYDVIEGPKENWHRFTGF